MVLGSKMKLEESTNEDKTWPEWWAGEETKIFGTSEGDQVTYIPYETRKLAMLCCLVLSSASKDDDAIKATVQIHQMGLLSAHAIGAMTEEELSGIVRLTGFHRRKTTALIGICREVVWEHGGIVPEKFEVLRSLKGVGDKIVHLLWSELLHQPKGIGTDSHVIRAVDGLGLIERKDSSQSVGKQSSASAVQKALLTWVPWQQYADVNKLFGCLGQMFTQGIPLRGTPGPTHRDYITTIAAVIQRHIQSPYDVALFFCIIKSIRSHYRKEENPHKRKKYKGSSRTFQYVGTGISLSFLRTGDTKELGV